MDLVHWLVLDLFGERVFALDTSIIVDDVKCRAVFQSRDDGGKGLEVAHALKGVDDADRDGEVVRAFDFAVEEFVAEEVRIGEVEFDLTNLSVWSRHRDMWEI